MSRFRQGFRLLAQSWKTLLKDPELLVIAAVGILLALGIYAAAFVGTLHGTAGDRHLHPNYLVLIATFLVASLIGTFTSAAIVGAARVRLKGGDPTIADGLRTAAKHAPKLIVWSLIQATIGVLLRTLEDRLPIAGRIATAVAGVAWAVVTMLVVPVLMFEHLGITDSVKRSASLVKERWGEGVSGIGSLGVAMLVIMFPLMVIPLAIMPISVAAGLIAFFAVFVTMMVTIGALGAVFTAALYEYAVTGQAPDPYRQDDFRGLYRSGRRRFFGLFGPRQDGPEGTPARPDR